jgi:two-component system, OmpR family, phosphate regulon sensor histidine kinase PhoR
MPLTDNPTGTNSQDPKSPSLLNRLLGSIGRGHKERQILANLQATMAQEHDKLAALLNTIDTGVLTTDSEGIITLYNSAALSILNITISISGQQLTDILKLVGPDQRPVDLVKEVKTQNRPIEHIDTTLAISDKESIALQVVIAPIASSYGKKREGYVITLRDITKQKSLDDQRNEFISVTSHELRTPIATIEASLSSVLVGEISEGIKPEALKMLDMAHKNTIYLGNLVKDLATLARAEGQYLGIDIKPVDPKKVVEEVVANYQKQAENRSLSLTVRPIVDLRPVLSSEIYISEIIQNFVTNAIKYTDKGAITVGAERAENNGVRFWVEDTGVGISHTDQKKLFTKFFRVEDFQTRETGGTGLGLYITKKLAERINGKVWCVSELGKGSTFFLEVPPISGRKTDARKISDAEIEDFANSL